MNVPEIAVTVRVCISETFQRRKYTGEEKMKSDIMKLFRTAISAVDPYVCVKDRLAAPASDEHHQIHLGETIITLRHNLYVAAFGKAALGSGKTARCSIRAISLSIRHVPGGR